MAPGGRKSSELQLALERIKAQGEDNLNDYHKALLKWHSNVDKKYAWVVLAALFFMMTATLGPYRLYSLMYAKVTTEDILTREDASWPVSMIFTVENVMGPLVSIICYHLTYSQSMFIGALLLTLGNGLCAFSTSLIIDVTLLGIVQGIGYAFIFMPFMEIINNYFLRYRNTALGLALCGGTLSIFFWSPIFQWLLDSYPWRYFYYGTGLVCSINILMVPLLKPNPMPKSNEPVVFGDEQKLEEKNNSGGKKRKLSRISIRALTYQNSIRRQSTIIISPQSIQRQASVISVNPFASTVGLERKISRAIKSDTHTQSFTTPNSTKSPSNTLSSNLSLPARMNTHLKNEYLNETMSLSEVGEHHSDFELSIIWEVLKIPGFHLIWFSELIYFWIFSIWCLAMVDYARDRGCTKDEAEALLSYQSLGELIGRLVLTILVDMRFVSNKSVVTLVLFILTGAMTLVTNVTGYIWFASITVALSAFLSLLYILLNGLLVDYLGERRVTIGYGMASCIGGILMSFRPQAVGYFRDNLGTYDPLMLSLAGTCAVCAILWILEPMFTRAVTKQEPIEERNNQVSLA